MPQVVGSGKTRKIVFDATDWLGGLVPQNGGGADPVADVIGKLSNARSFNPYRTLGYASPGYDAQDPTNNTSLGGYLRKGVVASSSIYATSSTDEIHKITIGSSPEIVDDADWPHQINSGTNNPIALDAAVYTHDVAGTNKTSVFYSWYDDTDWDVGTYNVTDDTFDDDWMTTAPASVLGSPYITDGQGKDHPLEVGEDDILYMGDRRFIHEYDGGTGTDGTVSEEVLKIPQDMEFKSFARFPQFLVGFAYKSTSITGADYFQGETRAYFWDYLSQDPTYVFNLNDNYVGEAFVYQGTVGVFTQGRTNDLFDGGIRSSKMQLFRGFGTGFTPEVTFDTDIPERGGVFVNDKMIHWTSGGHHYTYGSPFNTENFVLNKIGRGASNSTVSGMMMNPVTNYYLMSPSSLSGARLKFFKSGNYAEDTVFSSVNASPNFSEGMMGQVKAVRVHFAKPFSDGRRITLQIINQAQDNETILSTVSEATATTIMQEFKDPTKRLHFSTLKIFATYDAGTGNTDAPIIEKVEVFFTETNIIRT